jgi:hypothetical protein
MRGIMILLVAFSYCTIELKNAVNALLLCSNRIIEALRRNAVYLLREFDIRNYTS